jgi:hypothetical protein
MDGLAAHRVDQSVRVIGFAVGAPGDVTIGANKDEFALAGGEDVRFVERNNSQRHAAFGRCLLDA